MFTTPRAISLVLSGLALMATTAWAATSNIEGIVTDQNGKIIPAAEIRIEANTGNWSKIVKTDNTGRYTYVGLTAGESYKVTLLVKGTVKASITNVKTKIGDPTQLNFNLQKNSGSKVAAKAPVKKKTHTVWIPAETGSNLGGRWVEVDDSDGQGVTTGAERVQKGSNDTIRSIQHH